MRLPFLQGSQQRQESKEVVTRRLRHVPYGSACAMSTEKHGSNRRKVKKLFARCASPQDRRTTHDASVSGQGNENPHRPLNQHLSGFQGDRLQNAWFVERPETRIDCAQFGSRITFQEALQGQISFDTNSLAVSHVLKETRGGEAERDLRSRQSLLSQDLWKRVTGAFLRQRVECSAVTKPRRHIGGCHEGI